jgi:hypothetical protein
MSEKQSGGEEWEGESLFHALVFFMESAEHIHGFDGQKKKDHVLLLAKNFIINTWGREIYEKYRDILPLIIDFIIYLSKNPNTLDHINHISKCFGCF